ncbi:zinc metalloprotease [Seonamhaeicola maritimus]|uniref:Zinc metalloprotease n=1 Tax=Seonamhaeicola maritimus TaxID=2591822 RepID=A0A5C7GIG7_9FLAO|nr:zinc metalloprotease [Seonamhaeicola maritimus]TXG36905.1 zinc metalloprotease [Seonamhaeicola maritimus]
MKKLLFGLTALGLLFLGCEEDTQNRDQELIQDTIDMSDFYVYTSPEENNVAAKQTNEKSNFKSCFSMQNLNHQLAKNSGLEKKMFDIEHHTRALITAKKGGNGNGGGRPGGGNGGGEDPIVFEGTVTIPVVVHVLHRAGTNENISSTQINNQIKVLNDAFNGTDADSNNIPNEFVGVKAGNINIQFVLNDITRKETNKTSWPYSSAEEMKHSELGGVDAWDTSKYLNIWVVSQIPYGGGRILGYAQFPGGNSETDGVVMDYNDFGTGGTATYPNNLGKVTVHEVGHWLNLRHIWGDGRCKQDDFVSDTPNSDRANRGCPLYPTVHCRSNDMTMNYMDYTDDRCLFMFTQGQTDRMRALFASGGARESFVLP